MPRSLPTGSNDVLSVEVKDTKRPEYGTITMVFVRDGGAPGGLRLRGWVALDSQNNRTRIDLSNQKFNVAVADFGVPLDRSAPEQARSLTEAERKIRAGAFSCKIPRPFSAEPSPSIDELQNRRCAAVFRSAWRQGGGAISTLEDANTAPDLGFPLLPHPDCPVSSFKSVTNADLEPPFHRPWDGGL